MFFIKMRNKKNRFLLSLAAGMLAVVLAVGLPHIMPDSARNVVRITAEDTAPLAWWGTLYPEFCFGKPDAVSDEIPSGDDGSVKRVKISFWLAKAFNW